MPEAVIVAVARSAIGRAYKGSFKDVRPDDLCAAMIKAALEQLPQADPGMVEDIIVGCAQPAGEQGYNIGRVVGLLAGLRDVPGTTVNRYCASSLQAIRMAAHAIKAGEGDMFVAAGVECVSRYAKGKADRMPDTLNPRFGAAGERSVARAGAGSRAWSDAGGLSDIYIAMGQTAENVAQITHTTREQQDAFALRSQERAAGAAERGFFRRDITPYTLADGHVVDSDDSPRPGTRAGKLASLKPVFRPDGSVTAGNCCPLNDGAAAVVVMSETRAAKLGIDPLARIVSSGVSALSPEIMGLGPVDASRQALRRAGLTIADIDLVEMNEAFAAQVIPSAAQLGVPADKLNVNGGAIALGHPFGMTGARIMTTLIHTMQERRAKYGLETMCVGGGQGMAMIVERLA